MTDATPEGPNDRTSPVAVVDIDGVLADVRHRLHFLDVRPKDWDGFFAAARYDEPLPEGFAVLRELTGRYAVVYLSGRPERTRRQTERWLRDNGAPDGPIVLRRGGDRRPARLVKLAELRRLRSERGVVVVVDDDPQVCSDARAAGFEVLEADWADQRSEGLRAAQETDGRT